MERIWLSHYDECAPATLGYPDGPLQGLPAGAARAYADNIATIFFGAHMTDREVDDEASRLAHTLQKLGLAKGAYVALVLPNCPQFVVAYYAVLKAGGVVVPTNPTPRDVEEAIYEHPAVLKAVVAGVPNPYRGETVKAYIVLKEGMTATEGEIIAFCRDRIAGSKVPRVVEFRESRPKSLIGKHLRRVLVEEERAKLAATPAEGAA